MTYEQAVIFEKENKWLEGNKTEGRLIQRVFISPEKQLGIILSLIIIDHSFEHIIKANLNEIFGVYVVYDDNYSSSTIAYDKITTVLKRFNNQTNI